MSYETEEKGEKSLRVIKNLAVTVFAEVIRVWTNLQEANLKKKKKKIVKIRDVNDNVQEP